MAKNLQNSNFKIHKDENKEIVLRGGNEYEYFRITTVSYTHLDVYKRQVWIDTRFSESGCSITG